MIKPIAVSCGEPSGVGPEIVAKAWDKLRDTCPFYWIGDPRHLPKGTSVAEISDPSETGAACVSGLPVFALPFAAEAPPGQPDARNAAGVIASIETAVKHVADGRAAAVSTAPIHKKALIDGAGFAYPGHTEFLAALADVERVVMMLASDQLRVVPATIHIALADVPRVLTPEVLCETVRITHDALRSQFGISAPRIAIAGLNPHAGEGGAMGTEELRWINETIEQMQVDGYDLSGPRPADTMFHAAARKTYDAAIAMYHDQALIPIKTLDFDKGVNVTLGLPFVRTSPDHGTAFDIAGQGIANPTSMIEALKLAQQMAQNT